MLSKTDQEIRNEALKEAAQIAGNWSPSTAREKITELVSDEAEPERYGNTKVSTIRKRWSDLREAVVSEGTPAIQDAFERMEGYAPILYDMRNLKGLKDG